VIKIFSDDLRWKGKLLVFTWHFKEEYEKFRKPYEFIIEILDNGKHNLVAKTQNKYNVLFPYKGKSLCLSYVEHENIILIHIKPTTKSRWSS
jgi:hypothetical protein